MKNKCTYECLRCKNRTIEGIGKSEYTCKKCGYTCATLHDLPQQKSMKL